MYIKTDHVSNRWYTLQAKIAKRGRKLIDYDVARHNFDTMSAKRVDEVKLSKVSSPVTDRLTWQR